MNWKILSDLQELDEIIKNSYQQPQVIFKHSTRCFISASVKSRFEEDFPPGEVLDVFLLDLLAYRSVSNEVSERFSVRHESPQVLLVRNGQVVYHDSHADITFDALAKNLASIQ